LAAGDTSLFCGVEPEQIWHLKGIFVWFQTILGLKVNSGKSKLVLVGNVPNVEALVDIFGM
jgi:hypothetical protein